MSFENQSILFSSSVRGLTPVNSSFDRGVMQIAYHGANQNKSYISKDSFEKAIPSMYNCPVVCNYNRETDSIGAHDVKIIKDNNGVYMVNVTNPVGVVPESAHTWWEEVIEDNGTVHEYLCTDIYIWKRQEAYAHIKENIVTDESMEIKVLSGAKEDDGLFHIYSFEFTAFCLLESANPCFESAGIEMFSMNQFRDQYAQMMEDMKREFAQVMTASADDNTNSSLEGGNDQVNMDELMAKYGLSAEDIDFATEGLELEELERRFAEIQAAKNAQFDDGEGEDAEPDADPDADAEPTEADDGEPVDDEPAGDEPTGDEPVEDEPEAAPADDDDDAPLRRQAFSLTNRQLDEALWSALFAVKYRPEGCDFDCCRYWMIDFSMEDSEVYAEDAMNRYIVGMPFSMNGDNVVIDFEAAKRKRVAFVDFDEGEAMFSLGRVFEAMANEAEQRFSADRSELERLRKFEQDMLKAERAKKVYAILAQFSDLNGNEAFEALKNACEGMELEQIEDKCYAIRGRCMSSGTAQFSADDTSIKLPIEAAGNTQIDEPYGGIFAKYGIGG